jgi:hypothetical protein
MASIKIYTTLPDAALANDGIDPTIRQEMVVRDGEIIEIINRNLVNEAGEAGDTIKEIIRGKIKELLGLTDIEPAYVDVIQVSASGKEYRSKGWMRPDEAPL